MSCNCSTNNCGCDFTLPSGLTGETGATGATGPQGPSGAVIIADIQVNQATTTTGSYETLYTYTLSNPSPLVTAGDILEIYAYWSDATAPSAWRTTRIQFGGNTILGVGLGLVSTGSINHTKISLSRVTSTTAALATQDIAFTSTGQALTNIFYHLPNQLNASYQTVPNLDSGAHAITFQAYSTVIGDIHLDRIVILKLEKV